MPFERLEDLRVYNEAVAIGEEIWNMLEKWESFEKWAIGKQLADSADSISANIAESFGRTGTKEVVQFLIYARGSMYETKDRFQKAIRRKWLDPEQGQAILKRLEDLAPSLNAYITAKCRNLPQR